MRRNEERYCKLTEEGAEYLLDVFGNAGEGTVQNMNLRAGKYYTSRAVSEKTTKEEFKRICGSVYKYDAFFTPNTYIPGHRTKEVRGRNITVYSNVKESSMFCCYVWGIDIDYKSKYEKNFKPAPFKDPVSFYDFLMEAVGDRIPEPSYIEAGHQLRLIYILETPIRMKTSNEAAARALYKGLKAVSLACCKIINDALDCGAEPQKAWYRIPGSINTKNGEYTTVRVLKVSGAPRYTAQELMDEYLPSLPMNRQEYRKFKKNKKRNYKSTGALHRKRIEDYEKLASVTGIPREILVFLYGVSYKELHGPENLVGAMLSFNKRLYAPLKEKEITSKLRLLGEKSYKFRNDTIIQELGLSSSDCEELGLHLSASKKEKKKDISSLIALRKEKIRELYLDGHSADSIAELVDTNISVVRREITSIRSLMSPSARAAVSRKRKEEARWAEFEKTRSVPVLAPVSAMRRAVLMARGEKEPVPCSEEAVVFESPLVVSTREFIRGSP